MAAHLEHTYNKEYCVPAARVGHRMPLLNTGKCFAGKFATDSQYCKSLLGKASHRSIKMAVFSQHAMMRSLDKSYEEHQDSRRGFVSTSRNTSRDYEKQGKAAEHSLQPQIAKRVRM